MKTKKIRYWISMSYDRNFTSGFAVDFAPVRFCVREDVFGMLICDHYDTGRFFGRPCISKAEAIAYGVEKLTEALASGRYAKVINAYNRGEI